MKRRSIFGTWIALVVAIALPAATLAATTINNGGFESGTYTGGGQFQTLPPGSTAITGWTVGGAGVDWIDSLWTDKEGQRSVDLNALGPGSLSQTLVTTVNNTYVVEFWLAGNPTDAATCPTELKTLDVTANDGQLSSYTFNTTSTSYAAMGWAEEAYSFTATSSSTTLTFQSTTTGACGPALDDVTVTETVATGAQCKKDGWITMSDHIGNTFKNQGDCVSYYATDNRNLSAVDPA